MRVARAGGARGRRSSPATCATSATARGWSAATVERYGRVDVLCNNAGVGLLKSVIETEREEYDRVLDTNLWGLFACSRHAIPHMVAGGGGSVVNIGSVAATVGFATDAAYCASKGAVHALTRQMALDYAQHGVRVNCVAPGLHRDGAGAGLPRQPRRPRGGRAGDGRAAPDGPHGPAGGGRCGGRVPRLGRRLVRDRAPRTPSTAACWPW